MCEQVLKDDTLGPWLALFSVPQLSLRLSHALLRVYATPQQILSEKPATLGKLKLKPCALQALQAYQQKVPDNAIEQAVTAALNWQAAADDQHIVHWGHPLYPRALREIALPPLLLFVAGDPKLLNCSQLAVVGSRQPSVDGENTAYRFARSLSQQGVVMTSGLALGVDGAAHAGALAAQQPTIAVVATGIDRIYPQRHCHLAQQIRQQGALVSEFALGQAPRPQNFPRRNRIISGLSRGVLVVEAAIKSGSLITARCALEQNREVFAIPGSIHNPLSKGCHQLIREGAKLVESVQDIVEELRLQDTPPAVESAEPAGDSTEAGDPLQQRVLEKMGYAAVSMDTLVERTALAVHELSAILTQLTLSGRVASTAQGFVRVHGEPRGN